MSINDIGSIIEIVIVFSTFVVLLKLLGILKLKKGDVFNFRRDYDKAVHKTQFKGETAKDESGEKTFIGVSENRKNVFIPSDAKHVFVCGTTGSGKTIALSNFLKSGADYNYPMLIIDGKGDTDAGSLFQLTKNICKGRKFYIINLNEPETSDKYNPFKNTNTDVIKDMLINMTNWSEEHYKYNTERYIQRLCKLLKLKNIEVSLESLTFYLPTTESLTFYLPTTQFTKLSKDLSAEDLVSKEEHIENIELSKTSGTIAESAAARFATIRESNLGKIFDSTGIDIFSALQENAIILFILNPLLYPEMSPLIGNLITIDSKKAVSNFYHNRKKRIFYIFDEVNVYASSSLLDLVNKSRSANITCVLATQSLSDLDSVTPEFKEQIIENCNNYIILRQNSSTNAEHWSNVIGTRQTMQATYQIKGENGEAESTNLGSLRRTREYVYHPDDIKMLETGKAIFLSRDKMLHAKLKVNKPF